MEDQDKAISESDGLEREMINCRLCRLHDIGRAVPGEGPIDADIVMIGQNPGKEESRTGRPFVGRSGRYLDDVLIKAGLERDEIFMRRDEAKTAYFSG